MSVLSTLMRYYPYVFHPIVLVGGGLLLLVHYEWRRRGADRSALVRRLGAFLGAGVLSLLPTGAYVLVTGQSPMQVTQGNSWQVDALVASGVLVVCVLLWYLWRRFDWGRLVPVGAATLAAATVPYAALSVVWNVSGHVIFAVVPTLFLTLVDRKFWPLLVVPAVMVPNRVIVNAHTWLQSVGGLLLATAVVVAVYVFERPDDARPTVGTSGGES
ncbi:phosphoesterase [Halopelagius fulvigenes]|uniref:Phosphoesterase n=1 Tax=Halopelagius fulvigenes TaxID=1198324 RepID=A0ABD5TZZ9_9EURY